MKVVAFLVALIGVLLVAPAFAQEPASTVELGPFANFVIQWLLPAIGVVVTALAGWLVEQIRKRTGLEIEQQYRDAFQTAVTNAAGLALTKLGGNLAGVKVDLGNPAIAAAVGYVLKATPAAVDKFGLADKPTEIAEKIVAKLGVVAAGKA